MSTIRGFDAGIIELQRLIAAAPAILSAAAADGPDAYAQAVEAEGQKLVNFVNATIPIDDSNPKEIEKIQQLDAEANALHDAYFDAAANEIIGRIQERALKLTQLARAVSQQAAANNKTASQLRLTPVRGAIDAVTGIADALKKARGALLDSDLSEAGLKQKIDRLLTAIDAVEKAGQGVG